MNVNIYCIGNFSCPICTLRMVKSYCHQMIPARKSLGYGGTIGRPGVEDNVKDRRQGKSIPETLQVLETRLTEWLTV